MTLITKLDTKMECILSWNLLTVQGSMLLELNWQFQTSFPMKRNSSVTNLQTNLLHLGWVKFIPNNNTIFRKIYYLFDIDKKTCWQSWRRRRGGGGGCDFGKTKNLMPISNHGDSWLDTCSHWKYQQQFMANITTLSIDRRGKW